jgi:hypothetical protein
VLWFGHPDVDDSLVDKKMEGRSHRSHSPERSPKKKLRLKLHSSNGDELMTTPPLERGEAIAEHVDTYLQDNFPLYPEPDVVPASFHTPDFFPAILVRRHNPKGAPCHLITAIPEGDPRNSLIFGKDGEVLRAKNFGDILSRQRPCTEGATYNYDEMLRQIGKQFYSIPERLGLSPEYKQSIESEVFSKDKTLWVSVNFSISRFEYIVHLRVNSSRDGMSDGINTFFQLNTWEVMNPIDYYTHLFKPKMKALMAKVTSAGMLQGKINFKASNREPEEFDVLQGWASFPSATDPNHGVLRAKLISGIDSLLRGRTERSASPRRRSRSKSPRPSSYAAE